MILNIKIRAEKDVSVMDAILSLLKEYDVQEIKWDEGQGSSNVVSMAPASDEQAATAAVQQAARAQIQRSGRWHT